MTTTTLPKTDLQPNYRAYKPRFGQVDLPVVPCAECGVMVTDEIAASRFNKEGLCPACVRRKENPDLELKKFVTEEIEGLYSHITSLVELTEEERETIRNFVRAGEGRGETGRGIPENYLIEILFRVAAGQSYRSVIEQFNLEYGVTLSWHTFKGPHYMASPTLKPIIARLRDELKNVVRAVPITNPLSLALRLEKLYLESEADSNIKNQLAIIKTAWEMFGDSDREKSGTQINFVQVVNNISSRNMAERSAKQALKFNGSTNRLAAIAG